MECFISQGQSSSSIHCSCMLQETKSTWNQHRQQLIQHAPQHRFKQILLPCSIEELSSAFGFEELKHAAFCRMAVPLLFSLRPDFH